jgi:hypothetical protein
LAHDLRVPLARGARDVGGLQVVGKRYCAANPPSTSNADRHPLVARIGAVLDQPRVKLRILNHREMRENARVKALSRHLARHVPQVLADRQNLR